MGILPSFLHRSFGTVHAQPFCPHFLFVSLVFGHILSNGRAAFSGNIGIASTLAASTMKAVVGIVVSSLARCIAIGTGLFLLAGRLLASFTTTCD